MLTITRVRKEYHGDLCRRCLNEVYGVRLIPANCRYYRGLDECPRCGMVHHIVRGFTATGLLKTMWV